MLDGRAIAKDVFEAALRFYPPDVSKVDHFQGCETRHYLNDLHVTAAVVRQYLREERQTARAVERALTADQRKAEGLARLSAHNQRQRMQKNVSDLIRALRIAGVDADGLQVVGSVLSDEYRKIFLEIA